MQKYTVRVSKDYLGFSAAHFIVFGNNLCERLHGHNYQVAAEIEDELKADHLVFDFIEFKIDFCIRTSKNKPVLRTGCISLQHSKILLFV
ncbi:MAG: 6-carboxytetrahydropterin synthase [Planctomycetes bacterium]|nr:6-carboxytetrahydropterin synthase [Planctomycetota bacterium]